MSIYDVNGNVCNHPYDLATLIDIAYSVDGSVVYADSWEDEITVQKNYDSSANTYYYVIRIPQTRSNGEKQYPFVYAPNGTGAATQSTLEMNIHSGFYLAINAGVFYAEAGLNPIGVIIEDGILIQQGTYGSLYALTVDSNGMLGYASPNSDGQEMINDGIISAVVGFCPIVVNGESVDSAIYTATTNYNKNSQRQIIGQFSNGDYCIVTGEGRGFDSSTGWTIPQAINICLDLGLQFAYNLDGGGSTETVLGDEQINVIYEGIYGRIVPTYIVFNGTDTFEVPNAT